MGRSVPAALVHFSAALCALAGSGQDYHKLSAKHSATDYGGDRAGFDSQASMSFDAIVPHGSTTVKETEAMSTAMVMRSLNPSRQQKQLPEKRGRLHVSSNGDLKCPTAGLLLVCERLSVVHVMKIDDLELGSLEPASPVPGECPGLLA